MQELLAGDDDDMYESAARTKTRKTKDQDETEKVSRCKFHHVRGVRPDVLRHHWRTPAVQSSSANVVPV